MSHVISRFTIPAGFPAKTQSLSPGGFVTIAPAPAMVSWSMLTPLSIMLRIPIQLWLPIFTFREGFILFPVARSIIECESVVVMLIPDEKRLSSPAVTAHPSTDANRIVPQHLFRLPMGYAASAVFNPQRRILQLIFVANCDRIV